MTKEEAAEIILRGDAYKPCPTCKGCGGDFARDTANMNAQNFKRCKECKGSGHVFTPSYREALTILNHPAPAPPPTRMVNVTLTCDGMGGDVVTYYHHDDT